MRSLKGKINSYNRTNGPNAKASGSNQQTGNSTRVKKVLAHHTGAKARFHGSQLGDFVRKKSNTWEPPHGQLPVQIHNLDPSKAFQNMMGSGEMKKIISFEKRDFENVRGHDMSHKTGNTQGRERTESYVKMSYNVIVNGSQMINPSFNVVPKEKSKTDAVAGGSSLEELGPISNKIISQNIRNSLSQNMIQEEMKGFKLKSDSGFAKESRSRAKS